MSSASYSSAGLLEQQRTRTFYPGLVLVAALVASIPLENSTVLPSIGSIARLLGLVAAGAVIIDASVVLGFRRLHIAHVPLALFVIWSAWTCAWSVNPDLTSERIKTNLQLLLLVWVIWQSVWDLKNLRMALQGFVCGACCAAVLTFINARNLVAVDAIRYSGAGADPNELGLTLVMTLPMAYYLSRTATTFFGQWLWLVPIPLCIAGVILTVSRGAFISMVAALIALSIWHFKTSARMRFAPLIAGALLLVVGLAFVPKADVERISSIEGEVSSGRIGKRARLWKTGMELWQERPLTGVGAATFAYAAKPILGRELAAHNIYVSVLTETGIIGFLIFGIVLITMFASAMRLGTSERFLWLTVMTVWCIGVSGLTFEYKKVTWVMFGLLIATAGASGSVAIPLASRYQRVGRLG